MPNEDELVGRLEDASQKQEKEIVLELGTDRFLHFIGVYLVLALAAISKISELAGNNVTCYPANRTAGFDSDFIAYVRSYCWESSQNPACADQDTCQAKDNPCVLQNSTGSNSEMLDNPVLIKLLLQWMPYVMLLQAILLAMPSAWWHFRVGARLMGHLKFVQLLLNNIYQAVDSITQGIDKGLAYDEDSYFLNAWKEYKPYKHKSSSLTSVDSIFHRLGRCFGSVFGCCRTQEIEVTSYTQPQVAESGAPATGDVAPTAVVTPGAEDLHKSPLLDTGHSQANLQLPGPKADAVGSSAAGTSGAAEDKRGCASRFFLGDMLDRHLFSMICYENFASLEHHPYILSIYLLTPRPRVKPKKFANIPIKQGILRQLCHEKNFTGNFIVRSYVEKYAMGFFTSLGFLAAIGVVLGFLGANAWLSENFQCDVIYHEDVCVICTMHRKRDMLALLAMDGAILTLYILTSFVHWLSFRSSSKKASSLFFENINDTGSLALRAAFAAANARNSGG